MEEVPTIEHVFLSLRDSGVGWSMINDMGETDRYDNMHACENAWKKSRQLSMCFCL